MTITPNSGLSDGQTVSVQGSHFSPSDPMTFPYPDQALMVCRSDVARYDPNQLSADCSDLRPINVASDGSFTASITLHRVVEAQDGAGSFRCDESSQECSVFEIAYGGRAGYTIPAATGFSFAPK